MKRSFSLGLALSAMLAASPVMAAASLDDLVPVDEQELRGGTSTIPDVAQGNVSNTTPVNVGEIDIGDNSVKLNGSIGTASISGNHGIVSQMINSGDNNILNSGTNINIYMK